MTMKRTIQALYRLNVRLLEAGEYIGAAHACKDTDPAQAIRALVACQKQAEAIARECRAAYAAIYEDHASEHIVVDASSHPVIKCCPGKPAGHTGDCSAVPIRGDEYSIDSSEGLAYDGPRRIL